MAVGCIYHQVQTNTGGPWVPAMAPFRGTERDQARRFDEVCQRVDESTSVRLVEVKCIRQRNGKTKTKKK